MHKKPRKILTILGRMISAIDTLFFILDQATERERERARLAICLAICLSNANDRLSRFTFPSNYRSFNRNPCRFLFDKDLAGPLPPPVSSIHIRSSFDGTDRANRSRSSFAQIERATGVNKRRILSSSLPSSSLLSFFL